MRKVAALVEENYTLFLSEETENQRAVSDKVGTRVIKKKWNGREKLKKLLFYACC